MSNTNWTDLARRIDALHDELLTAAAEVPNEIDAQFVELQALSMRHLANHLDAIGENAKKPRGGAARP